MLVFPFYSSANLYPTPISVRIYLGFAGISSIFRLSPATKALNACVSEP